MSTLENVYQGYTQAELEGLGLQTILSNLGIWLIGLETPLPVWPFVALAFALTEIFSIFGSGRPKDEDTNNVIWAYHMSAYWPLQALGTDLAIALKNGAPISDSQPAIQAQFSQWKQGTIESIQQLAGYQGGPGDPGYWQLQSLINTSWAYSKLGQQTVLKFVKAIDQFTIGLSQLHAQNTTTPPPPPPPGGGGTGGQVPPPGSTQPPPGCASGDPDSDEPLDNCAQTSALLNTIIGELQNLGAPAPTADNSTCCVNITAAIKSVSQALVAIGLTISGAGRSGVPSSTDLSGIQADLDKLAAALEHIASTLDTQLAAMANALTTPPGPLATPTITVPKIPPPPTYGPADFSSDLEAAKEQLLGETQVFGA